jgi:superfamily II RNA helicase
MNLPARNIFLLKPTTGRGSPISGAGFWNLAGRAGRLGKELEGNVYLIDYDDWETKPVQETKDVTVTSALKSAMVDRSDDFWPF